MTVRLRQSARRRSLRNDGRRLVSMLFMLILLGMMISYTSRPSSWQWLVDDVNAQDAVRVQEPGAADSIGDPEQIPPPEEPAAVPPAEIEAPLVPNPTDQDPEEWAAAQDQFRDIQDRKPFSAEEMPSYWRLFRWVNAQTRQEMYQRSTRDPFFTQLWEQPAKNRGKLFSMKLHVRRVLSHEPEENSAGVKKVYELWGVTDESRSHLYVVLTDTLPEGFPQGAKVEADAHFTGYFLKILGYEATDAQRGAPLLIGKIKNSPIVQMPRRDPVAARNEFTWTVIFGVWILCLFAVLRFLPASWIPRFGKVTSGPKARALKHSEEEVENWLSNAPPSALEDPIPPRSDQRGNPFEKE
ncbi:MAG TPA: hypothetical protein VNQ76_15710 [Planctomicrobium sp.]|nr:hypothetical protein [Planctomicrobium sp.]